MSRLNRIIRRLSNIRDAVSWAVDDERAFSYHGDGYEISWVRGLARVISTRARWTITWARCATKGHPPTEDRSWAGPESGGEDLRCKCGTNHFHHTYY